MLSTGYYNSIHNCPIAVFNRVMNTGDTSLLGKGTAKALASAWEKIIDEYIKEIGLPDSYVAYLSHMRRYAKFVHDAFLKGQKHLLNFAEIERAKAMQNVGAESGTFMEGIAKVSKAVGFRIDPNQVTVSEYYAYIKTLGNG